MEASIWVAIITGFFTFAGVLVTVIWGNKRSAKNTEDYKNLTIYRIEQLEKKQDLHNHAVERLFRVEGNVTELQHEVKYMRNKLDE